MCNENSPLFEYKSIRFISIRNKKLASIYYSLLLGVLLYIIIYTIIISKGYQEFDEAIGTTTVKVKGTASTGNGTWRTLKVYDAMDLIYPATEQNALFITTAHVLTPNQTRGICQGNENTGSCVDDSDCDANVYNWRSEGIYTGKCQNGYCTVNSWCPLENDSNPEILTNVGAFSAFVKVDIRFPLFNVRRTNTLDKQKNGRPIWGYNLFTLNQMLHYADKSITSYEQIALDGAVILATSEWDCDLDKGASHCQPKWNFKRLDNQTNTISVGHNFRQVQYDITGEKRRLRKLMGVRIIFAIDGHAGRFSFAAISVTFGAGIAYLGIASIIADLFLQRFLRDSEFYDNWKTRRIVDGIALRIRRTSAENTPNVSPKKTHQKDIEF